MKRHQKSMLSGPLFPSIVSYTVPIILTSVLQLLFNAADMIVVGQFCGSISLAAVGATGSITNLIVNLFIGLSVGAGVSAAHAIGSREDNVLHNVVHTALPTALVSGVIITVLGLLVADPMLRVMETPEKVLPLSVAYMQTYFLGMTFTMVYNFCSAILRAAGDTRSPLIFLTIAGVVNVVLNLFFVIVCDLNVVGVGLATAISQGVSAVLVVIALMRRTDACRLDLKKIRFYKPQLLKLLRIGLPAGLQSSLFALSNVIIQSSVNSFGEVVMSGNAAAANIEGFLYVAGNAFYQTALNFTGQNVGAKQYKRVFKTVWLCMLCAAVTVLSLSIIFYLFGEVLLGIYITDSVDAIGYGMVRLLWVGIPYFLLGIMEVSTGALRGMGASLAPMLISVLGVCGMRIGWIFTVFQLPAYHSIESLYVSYPISWLITFIAQLLVFLLVYRRAVRRSAVLAPKEEL